MIKNTFKAGFLLLTLCITSCATLFTGTTQKVTVDSYPQGAQIIVDGEEKGTTPSVINIDKDIMDLLEYGKVIELNLDGYERSTQQIETDLNPVAILNLLNPFFWTIDAATGAISRYEEYSKFDLKPLSEKPNLQIKNKDLSDKYEQIEKLKKLKEQGAITQDEFEQEKAKLLAE